MKASANAITLIKRFEKCKLEAYEDIGGVWTIGWGTTGPGIQPNLVITQKTADAMLGSDINQFGQEITKLVGPYVSQDQFDALVSLAYNIGINAFKKSTLLALVKAGKMEEAAEQFPRWDHVDGKEVEGLKERRLAEQRLFNRKLELASNN